MKNQNILKVCLMVMTLLVGTAIAAAHTLKVKARPDIACTFNKDSVQLEYGNTVSLSAYTQTGFKFLRWEDETGNVVSVESYFQYTMPGRDVTLYAVCEYNPENPGNPNKNYWDKSTGEVIVDDFTPGNLSSAISSAISGSNRSDVKMITVSGIITNNDLGIINNYSNCTFLDLSRVTGVTEIPSYAFDYTNLETVYLPSSIEKIGYRAFASCANLTSLTVYAMTPPTLESYVFSGVPEGLVVYVPAAAIPQYQDDSVWGQFVLLPIQEDIRNISVALPAGTSATDYTQMWLELTNTKNGQRIHYVMTDRTSYTFANIIRNTTWNVTLRNERGDVFGKIENVEVKDEDVAVTFTSLSKPQNVTLSVLTPDSKNVTDQVQVTWTDEQGNYIAQNSSLAGLPSGCKVNYRVVLSQELAMAYVTPAATNYTLKNGGNAITCQLQTIQKIQISGKVKEASTNLPLGGAVISASQTFDGKYSQTLSAKSDKNGVYTMEIAAVPTSLAISASDFISQTLDYTNNEFSGLSEFSVPDVTLNSITGATISLTLSYTDCDGETQDWYSDYQNVDYVVYNVTKNHAIDQIHVQYPQIVLMEDVEDGDVLRLTASSLTKSFVPVETTATILNQKAEVSFAIKELGRIQASFVRNSNASVVGSLYDSNSKLIKSMNYVGTNLTISDLADGRYTLVTMGGSDFYNDIYDLDQLPQAGLTKGTDYAQNTVDVMSGVVSMISIDNVPKFDESKFYYTNNNTSFTVNKSSIVVGNYLTLTGHIDFKPEYAKNVSNVNLIVDLPESCKFVENSVMVGNTTSSYILNENQVVIPMSNYSDRVRFCMIPTSGGEFAPNAFVQFDLNKETVRQPIGSANYEAKDLSISVPTTASNKMIAISGTANGTSAIEIYDGEVLIGQTESLANGTWMATCELHNPYNLSSHQIYSKAITKQGIVLNSEKKECFFDSYAIEAKTVEMSFYNGWMHKTIEVTFDLEHKTSNVSSYSFYHETDFTFAANLSNNDTTIVKGVTIGVYSAKEGWIRIPASYNEEMDRWIAVHKFSSANLPIGVNVDIKTQNTPYLDAQYYDNQVSSYANSQTDYIEYQNYVDGLLSDIYEAWSQPNVNEALLDSLNQEALLLLGVRIDREPNIYDENNIDELINRIDNILNDSLSLFKNNFLSLSLNEISDLTSGITFGSTDNLTEDILLSQGFSRIEKSDGTSVYIFMNDEVYKYADLVNSLYYEIDLLNSNSILAASIRSASSGSDFPSRMRAFMNSLWNAKDDIISKMDILANAASDIIKKIDARELQIGEELYDLGNSISYLEKNGTAFGKSLIPGLKAKQATLLKEGALDAKILSWINHHISPKMLKMGKIGGGALAVFDIGFEAANMISDLNRVVNTYYLIPEPCEGDQQEANSLRNSVIATGIGAGGYYVAQLVSDAAQIALAISGATAAIPSGGTTLSMVGAAIGLAVASIIAEEAYERVFNNTIDYLEYQIKELDCFICPICHKKPCQCCPICRHYPCVCEPIPEVKPILDPSGFVYESVTSNRLEGVTATVFYKENVEDMYGDLHENIVKWDAEEYAQENPLFTDEFGMYAWDVPQGLWQVKFEKEGYETTFSEWLPVPPPQLDVNIAMTQNRQPEVKMAHAYEDAVEVEFDKYMIPELLNTDNVTILQNGNPVEGTIKLLNEEYATEDSDVSYASKIRFNASALFSAQEVTLMVSNRVKSYAGIRMQDDYQQVFTVEKEIKQIVCDSLTVVTYGEEANLTVNVLPAEASKGKILRVNPSSQMMLGLDSDEIAIDNEGKAEVSFTGYLPGTAALTFSIDGTDKTATTIVQIKQISDMVAAPTASIASGSTVFENMSVVLSCSTPNAIIYYTLDGSCPCDEDARLVYTGPIAIVHDMKIKAMAVSPDGHESDIVEFVYYATGIENVFADDANVRVYPSPVKDRLNISANGKTIQTVSITNMGGVPVLIENASTDHLSIDVSALTNGFYVVEVITESGNYKQFVIKE